MILHFGLVIRLGMSVTNAMVGEALPQEGGPFMMQAAVAMITVLEPGVTSRIAMITQRLAPGAYLVAWAPEQRNGDPFRETGARAVVLEGLTTAVKLAERVVIQLEDDALAAV